MEELIKALVDVGLPAAFALPFVLVIWAIVHRDRERGDPILEAARRMGQDIENLSRHQEEIGRNVASIRERLVRIETKLEID